MVNSKYTIHNVFPSKIYQKKLEEHDNLKNILLELYPSYSFDPLSKQGYYLATGEHHGKVDVHKEKDLINFFVQLKQALREYFEHLNIPSDFFDFTITKSWYTYLLKDYSVNGHTHFGNGLSFVYYIESGGEKFELDFVDSYERKSQSFGGSFMGTVGKSQDYFRNAFIQNSTYKLISEEGTLLLFPSYLAHGIPPFSGSSHRLSYVGDIFISLKEEYLDFEFGYPSQNNWLII